MKTFEEDVPFERLIKYSEPYMGMRNFWIAWLQDILISLMNRQSPYRYITRIVLAKEHLQNISDEHIYASKLMLQAIIFNIAPPIGHTGSSIMGLLEEKASPNADRFEPLDDTAVTNFPKAVVARYSTLEKAADKYVAIGLKVISCDMEQEQLPDFEAGVAELKTKVVDLKRQLSDARQKLYIDFPEKDLTSVSRFVIHKEKKLEKAKGISPVVEEDLQKVVRHAESTLGVFTNSMTNQARAAYNKLKVTGDRYRSETGRLQVIWELLKTNLNEEGRTAAEERFTAAHERIDEKFSVEFCLPEEFIKRLQKDDSISSKE